MNSIKLIQTEMIPLSDIEQNHGQIDGLPANPRIIRNEKFEKLKKSIVDNPEMLSLRELLVYKHGGKYVTIGGNMRLNALQDLQYEKAPCKVIPENVTIGQLKAYVMKDNAPYGEWDYDMLANEWDTEQLKDWGVLPDDWEEEESLDFENNMSTSTPCDYLKFGKISIPISEDELNELTAIHDEYLNSNGTNLGFVLQIVEKWKE
jgi:hypothetical protein